VLTNPLVATVSLGERRRFVLRPSGGGRVVQTFHLAAGDLLVMGGACQHEWEHAVPKVAAAGARMGITQRHSRPAPT
jgi:alkylated DNA repair dioxygenase AlkB